LADTCFAVAKSDVKADVNTTGELAESFALSEKKPEIMSLLGDMRLMHCIRG
jgi:hypothetical protein